MPGAADSRLASVVRSLSDVVVGRVRPALLVLLSAALLVFLVAVLNLGGLLVVRTIERQQEFALRRALGASRLALIRQVTIEGGVVVALGGLVGVGLAWAALRLIPAVAPQDLPRVGQLELSSGVILASLGLAMLGVALAGFLPALTIQGVAPRISTGRNCRCIGEATRERRCAPSRWRYRWPSRSPPWPPHSSW